MPRRLDVGPCWLYFDDLDRLTEVNTRWKIYRDGGRPLPTPMFVEALEAVANEVDRAATDAFDAGVQQGLLQAEYDSDR